MRIMHLVHQYMPEHVGGTELYTRWLTQAQSRHGHQVAVFYRRSAEGMGQKVRTEGDVRVWSAWAGETSPARRFLNTFRDPRMVSLWEKALQEFAPDLVHIEHLMGLPVALVGVIQRCHIPYVITLWDFWWVCANANLLTNYSQQICDGPQAYLNCARCALARSDHARLWPALPLLAGLLAWRNRLLRQVLQAASALVAPSEFVHRWYAGHSVPTERLEVIAPGLERARGMSRKRVGGPLRFAYVGGLARIKGVHVLLDAFGKVHGAKELWIAGDAPPDDQAYAAHLCAQVPPGVRFLGKLTRQEVWDILAQVDVVVAPSLCYETFSFIVSEAFAAGVPVVASRQGALADRVHDGVDGLLVPPGDVDAWWAALQRLVDDRDVLERLRANVRPPMTIKQHARRMTSVYASLIDGTF